MSWICHVSNFSLWIVRSHLQSITNEFRVMGGREGGRVIGGGMLPLDFSVILSPFDLAWTLDFGLTKLMKIFI